MERSSSKLKKVVSKNQFEIAGLIATPNPSIQNYLNPYQKSSTQDYSLLDDFQKTPLVSSRSNEAIMHLKVKKVLSQQQQMYKYQNPLRAKDIEQPRFGDLKIEYEKKFYRLSSGQEFSSDSSIFSPLSDIGFRSLTNFNEISEKSINQVQQNVSSKDQSKEILRVRQLKNLNCRPVKNNINFKFEKSQSSILQKRRKERIKQIKITNNQQNIKYLSSAETTQSSINIQDNHQAPFIFEEDQQKLKQKSLQNFHNIEIAKNGLIDLVRVECFQDKIYKQNPFTKEKAEYPVQSQVERVENSRDQLTK